MNYVVGFMFAMLADGLNVALIQKIKPEWQKGCLNGIGGKIEPGEEPLQAMIREFEEETGCHHEDWKLFVDMDWEKQHRIYFYKTFTDSDTLIKLENTTEEQVLVVNVNCLDLYKLVHNVKWLIPLALDKDNCTANVYDGSNSNK